MPTSKKRSGNSLAKFNKPVDDAMAAVIAQTSGRRVAAAISASPNTAVYVRSVERGRPVSGSNAPTPCRLSISASTAGAKPGGFPGQTVAATGGPKFLALEKKGSRRG